MRSIFIFTLMSCEQMTSDLNTVAEPKAEGNFPTSSSELYHFDTLDVEMALR